MQFNDTGHGLLRFYQIALQQDLLGAWFVITESGIQGESGRVQKKLFQNLHEAEEDLIKIRDKQIRKGYQIVFVKALNQT